VVVDRSLPHGGIEFGGNGVTPISWPHWFAAATLGMPSMRNYRLPEPPALRVGRDGLHVHMVAEQGRRVRTYVYVPWHAVGALSLAGTSPAAPSRPALRFR
jgi:hypothetical protein